jgi:hypothetical protein
LSGKSQLTVKQVFGEAYWLMPRFVPTKRNTLTDSGFMRDLRTGIARLEREEALTFQQVFGEAY